MLHSLLQKPYDTDNTAIECIGIGLKKHMLFNLKDVFHQDAALLKLTLRQCFFATCLW